MTGKVDVYFGDNLETMRTFPDGSFDLIYADPPFNTGKKRRHTRLRTTRDENGTRTGFGGHRYKTVSIGSMTFADVWDDFLEMIEPRLVEAYRVLSPTGSLFLHIDYREVHYCKVLLDQVFGRESFMNEIIWAYDYGGRTRKRWPAKHDNILWYAKDPRDYTFRYADMDRIPYMAPGLVTEEKARRGKTPTDTWWHTIVAPSAHERTGYPTQKPVGVVGRIVRVHSDPGDHLLDFCAGSGTLGEVAAREDRSVVLLDNNADAMTVMARRLAFARPTFHGWSPTPGSDDPGSS